MGLIVYVGYLAEMAIFDSEAYEDEKKNISLINELLEKKDLPQINEPEDLYPMIYPFQAVNSFPYGYLSKLCCFAAYSFYEKGWNPTPAKENWRDIEDSFWERFYPQWEKSHLINHSDCEGYYLPIQFTKVIINYGKYKILAPPLGSSYKLLDELRELAPNLGIKLNNGSLPTIEELNHLIDKNDDPFLGEKIAWIALFQCAELSIKHKALIRFS